MCACAHARACARRGQVIAHLFRCATSPCDLSFMPLFPASTQLPLMPSLPDGRVVSPSGGAEPGSGSGSGVYRF